MGKKHGPRQPKALSSAVFRVESGGWLLSAADWAEIATACQPKLRAMLTAAHFEAEKTLATAAEASPMERGKRALAAKRAKAEYASAVAQAAKGNRNDASPLTGKIESDAAAGHDFIEKTTKIVNGFIVEVRRERTTPRADSTAEWLERLGKAAAAFHAAYNAPLAPAAKSMVRADVERMTREATVRVDREMPRDLSADHPRATPTIRLADLAAAAQRVAWAAKKAASELIVEPELDGGAAWRRFVVRLRDLCAAFGLRTGISSTGDDAAFVVLVAAILTKLPPEVARSSSPEALAKAMQRAVSEQRNIDEGRGWRARLGTRFSLLDHFVSRNALRIRDQ